MPPLTNIPNNSEIDKALKEFEANGKDMSQSGAGQTASTTDEVPRMVKLVMKLSGGAIKEQKQAEYVLLGFIVVAVAVSLYLFFGGGGNTTKIPSDALEIMKQAATGQ